MESPAPRTKYRLRIETTSCLGLPIYLMKVLQVPQVSLTEIHATPTSIYFGLCDGYFEGHARLCTEPCRVPRRVLDRFHRSLHWVAYIGKVPHLFS